jgi:hypothetical protein
LRTISEKAGLMDRQKLDQSAQFGEALQSGEQTVIFGEGLDVAGAHSPMHAVAKEVEAPLIEMEAALAIHDGANEAQLGIAHRGLSG